MFAIALLLLVTMPAVYVVIRHVSAEQGMYFWNQVHGRVIAMIRPGLFLLASLSSIEWICRFTRRPELGIFRTVLAICSATALPAIFLALWNSSQPLIPLSRELSDMDQHVRPISEWNQTAVPKEAEIYYALSRELETK